MKTILADRLDAGGERITWQPPAIKIEFGELRQAEAHLGARLIPITKTDFVLCMLALRNMLAIPTDDQMTWDARIKLYWNGLNDHPADLLSLAVDRCIKVMTFFPKVAPIRDTVKEELRLRRDMLARTEWLIKHGRDVKPAPAPFVREPEINRHRAAIWRGWHWRIHFPNAHVTGHAWQSAIQSERWLANAEGREPAAWAMPAKANDSEVTREVLSQVFGPPKPPPPAPAANVTPEQVGDLEW